MAVETVKFINMSDGDYADYQLLAEQERQHNLGLADRLLDHLQLQTDSYGGYKISRYQHSLQTATRAERDGADDEYVVAALLHDIGDMLAPLTHSEMAASVLRPFVRDEVHWVIKHHGLFQGVYYFHHYGDDRNARDVFKDHPWYQACVDFCERWDQCSFDPDYDTLPLEHFAPRVHALFAKQPQISATQV